MNTAIVDYGMGNLLSVKRAFEKAGEDTVIVSNPKDILEAEHIVLPGVGAFDDAICNIKKYEWDYYLNRVVLDKGVPLLGICLGMQLFATYGYENKKCKGLNYIVGNVIKLESHSELERIPHVGWNDVRQNKKHPVFEGIDDKSNFYFVHSFHFVAQNDANIIASTPYCGEFISCVAKDNIVGVQFHPEKSQKVGIKLIQNFLKM